MIIFLSVEATVSFVGSLERYNNKIRSDVVALSMGKGFNRAKNKQAELAKKLATARKEKGSIEGDGKEEDDVNNNIDKERKLFDELLSTTKGAIPTDDDTESAFIANIKAGQSKKPKVMKPPKSPLIKQANDASKKKEEEKVAQRLNFERLVEINIENWSNNPLGPIGAAQLVPWVPPYLNDCLVVFVDPRSNSGDLRQTIKYLTSNLEDDKSRRQVIFVTADSTQEMKS
jgi:hypothetical protein